VTPGGPTDIGGGVLNGGSHQDGGGTDSGSDSGFDAGGGTCDAGCLGLGEPCQIDQSPNGGCAPGLQCLISLTNGTTYTCQNLGGDM